MNQSTIDAGADFIAHHGVKGMKWGVRRKSKGSVTPGKTEGKTQFKKDPNRLSDAELKRRIARLDMEKRYADLIKAPVEEKKVTRGQKFKDETWALAKSILVQSVKQSGTKALTGVFDKELSKQLGKSGAKLADLQRGLD